MNRHMWRSIVAVAAVLAIGAACGDDDGGPETPVPGTLVLTLTTPNDDDGAILFSVSGGAIDDAAAESSSHVFFFRSIGTSSINAVIAGDIGAGAIANIDVPDIGAASSYAATVTEVADRANQLRASVSGYSIAIAAAP